MKTSNIILFCFFLLVFLVPFLVSVAVKNKVSSGKYARLINQKEENQRKLATGKSSVLKIKGPSNRFHCTIIRDDSSYIEYERFETDSIGSSLSGDTLSVFFIKKESSVQWERDQFNFVIHTPALSAIYVQAATVDLVADEYYNSHNVLVSLSDHASLTLFNREGSKDSHEEEVQVMENSEDQSEMRQHPEKDTSSIAFDRMEIIASASTVNLGNFALVNNLDIRAGDKSRVFISPSFKYENITGTIADNAEVSGPWYSLRNLKNVNK